VPGLRELDERERSIRQMPAQGDLLSTHNYLDIVFRLLHEDAINDLRKGVIFMQKLSKDAHNDRRKVRKELKT
jgi:hypothetical protein